MMIYVTWIHLQEALKFQCSKEMHDGYLCVEAAAEPVETWMSIHRKLAAVPPHRWKTACKEFQLLVLKCRRR